MPYPVSITATDLNTELAVWRAAITKDKVGGRVGPREQVATEWGKVPQSTGSGTTTAQQPGAAHTVAIHFRPGANVQRGDELRTDTETYKVISTHQPSTAIYLRADCEYGEAEQGV